MGHGNIRKRGGIWWLRYSVEGRRYEESAKTSRKEEAEALLRRRLQGIWEGMFFPEKGSAKQLTLDGLKDLWIKAARKATLLHDSARLGRLLSHFGGHRLVSSLTSAEIDDWRQSEEAQKLEPSTRNRHLAVLRSALNLASARGFSHRNPMAGVKFEPEKNQRNRTCTPDEFGALCAAAGDEMRLLVVFGYWTGMRLGELTALTRDRVDTKSKTLRLGAAQTKEAGIKTIPLPTEAVAILDRIPRRIDGKLFGGTRPWWSRKFSELCVKAKIEGLHFHDLRHTAASNMRRAGVDIITIQAITGHKTLAMLQRYSHVTDDDLRTAMDSVESHAAGRDRS